MKRLGTLSLLALISLMAAAPANADPQYGFGFRPAANANQQYGFRNGTNAYPQFGFRPGTNGIPQNGFGFRHGGSGIDQTQAQLQARINSGVASGRLTRREAAKLQARLDQIARLEARLRMTGNRLSERERIGLRNQLAILNEKITDDMNDVDRRWDAHHWNNGRQWH